MLWVLYTEMGPVGSTLASALITFILLRIEHIGVSVEDTSRILPVKEMCASIEEDVLERRDNHAKVQRLLTLPIAGAVLEQRNHLAKVPRV
jgi:predicted membrane chloride channel (bestrophin family)